MRDKTVNVPIFETDVLKTVESLPRTPTEAGIIPINLKRKLSFKNSHKIEYSYFLKPFYFSSHKAF